MEQKCILKYKKQIDTLREKCLSTEFFLVYIFLHSDWIRRDTEYLSVFSPNKEKYGPEKTPHWDTFRAVKFSKKTVDNDNKELLWLNQSSGSEKTSFWHFYAVIDLLFILCFPVFLPAFFFVLNIRQNELSLQNAMVRWYIYYTYFISNRLFWMAMFSLFLLLCL